MPFFDDTSFLLPFIQVGFPDIPATIGDLWSSGSWTLILPRMAAAYFTTFFISWAMPHVSPNQSRPHVLTLFNHFPLPLPLQHGGIPIACCVPHKRALFEMRQRLFFVEYASSTIAFLHRSLNPFYGHRLVHDVILDDGSPLRIFWLSFKKSPPNLST